MTEAALDARLLAAHARGETRALPALYARAADGAEAAGEVDRACFYLTQAWVFALEAGAAEAGALAARLAANGRDVPGPDTTHGQRRTVT